MNVRSIDIGYGHVKFIESVSEGIAQASSFPSQAVIAHDNDIKGSFIQKRDTFVIPIKGTHFEVGRNIHLSLTHKTETEALDKNFAISDTYRARMYGAFNYMLPYLANRKIDILVLGLPLTTFAHHEKNLARLSLGKHTINLKGDTIEVERCYVVPQPLGSYAAFLSSNPEYRQTKRMPIALVIDPGYNTVDSMICEGNKISPANSYANELGMNVYLRRVADAIMKENNSLSNPSHVVRLLDRAYSEKVPFKLYGEEIDLAPYEEKGISAIEEAVQAIVNKFGSGEEIDVIVLSGGGANIFEPVVRSKFPRHKIVLMQNHHLANVKGFQKIGEEFASSAKRAIGV